MPLGVEIQEIAGEIEMRVIAQAGEDVGNLACVRRGEKWRITRDDRQTMVFRERAELADCALFPATAMALQFDEDVIRAEAAD